MPGTPDPDAILWQHLSSLPYFRGMLRAVEHSFYAELDLPQPILDLGAGDGHFASLVFSDPVYVGLDPWREPLQEARTRNTYQLLTQANGAQMPFPDGSFATVISNSVLEHIPDLDPVLQEVQRVLQPDGLFVFCVPNHRFLTDLWGQTILKKLGLHKLAARYNRFFNRIARHHHLDPFEVWQKRLESAGLVVENFWHYFPVEAMHILERGHLFGLPNLLWKKLLGRWVLFPHRANPFIPHRRLLKYMPANFLNAKGMVSAKNDRAASPDSVVTARNDRAASSASVVTARNEAVSAFNDRAASPDSVVTARNEAVSASNDRAASPDSVAPARNDRAASCKELASVVSVPDGTCTFYIARRSS